MKWIRTSFYSVLLFSIFCTTLVASDLDIREVKTTMGGERQLHFNLDTIDSEVSSKKTLKGDETSQAGETVKSFMSRYREEAFLANLVYNMNSNDIKHSSLQPKFYFGKYKYAKLLYHEDDETTGFTAGIFMTNTGKFIVSFGGTTAKSSDGKGEALTDIITDLNLLNQKYVHPQYQKAIAFTVKAQDMISVIQGQTPDFEPSRDVSITGHSLGGALAQFSSLYSGYKAVTFDTAPISLSEKHRKLLGNISDDTIKNREKNIINIYPFNDPLTSVVESIEKYAQNKSSQDIGEQSERFKFLYEQIVTPVKKLYSVMQAGLKFVEFANDTATTYLPIWSAVGTASEQAKEIFKIWAKKSNQFKILNDTLKKEYGINNSEAILLEAIQTLKAKDVNNFVKSAMLMYNIKSYYNLEKLIYGNRVLLPVFVDASYGHSMLGLIKKIYGDEAITTRYRDLMLPYDAIFSDVSSNNIFYEPIAILASEGIVDDRKTNFHPDNNVTYAELFKMATLYIEPGKWDTYKNSQEIMVGRYPKWAQYIWQTKFKKFISDYVSDVRYGYAKFLVDFEDLLKEDNLDKPIDRSQAIGLIDIFIMKNSINPAGILKLTNAYKVCPSTPWGEAVNLGASYARSRGIIQGYSDGCFHGNDLLTRGQMAKIVVKAKNWIERNRR